MPRRIVLFGASGYTGRLVAEALVRARARPVLAGRNHQSLAALGARLGKGLDIAIADAARPESLLEIIRDGDVLISTVGPFLRYGRPVAEAAILRHARYLDSTGEPPFIRMVQEELAPLAAKAGATLLTAAAFDYAAGDLAATLALQAAGAAAMRVDVGYIYTGGRHFSAGTRASTGGSALLAQPVYRDGAVFAEPAATRVRTFMVEGRQHAAVSIGSAEHYWLPRRFPGLWEVNVYLVAVRSRRAAALAGKAIRIGHRVPGAAAAVAAASRWSWRGEGPGPARRSTLGSAVEAAAYDGEGRELHSVRLAGIDAYTFTGNILAWQALQLAAAETVPSGAPSPVDVFGVERFREAVAEAGLREGESEASQPPLSKE